MAGYSKLSVALLLGLAALLASEVGLRLLTSRSSRWNVRLGAQKQFDPVSYVRLKPHYEIGSGVFTNERGWQAPENLSFERPVGELRLLYLGDSNSFLPHPQNYPRLAEAMLQEAGIAVQTVNTAVPGWSSDNALRLFEAEISLFDADYLFVYLGWNDLAQFGPEGMAFKRQAVGYELNPVQRLLTNIYSLRFVYAAQQVLARREPAVVEPLGPEEAALYAAYRPDHFEENLERILALGKSRYPNVYVMTLATITNDDPTPSELARAHFPIGMGKNMRKLNRLVAQYNEVVREVAARLEVPIIDLHAMFDDHASRELFKDSCHVNLEGALRIARAVADIVGRAEAAEPRRTAEAR